jgi:hypothetical protein
MFIAEVVWRKAGHGSRKNWTLAQFNPGTGYRVSVEDYPPKGGEAVIARLSGHDYVLHFWKFHIPSVDLPNGGYLPRLYRPMTEEECDRLRFEDDPFLDEEDAKEVFSRLPFVQNDKEGGRALEPYTPRFWEDAIQSSFTIAHRWIAHQVSEPDLFKVSLQQVSLVWARHRATTVSHDTIVEYGACRKGFLAAAYRADILEVFPEEGPTLGQVFLVVNSEEDALYLEKLIKYVEDRYVSST